jgi:hypothetical protein
MAPEDYDETDMGPFSDMDPEMVRAVTNYGTPPYRNIVSVSVRDVGSYSFNDLPETIDGWITWLEKAKAEAPEQYRNHLNCVLSFDRGHWDEGDSASLDIWYDRPETDAEMTERVGRGLAYVRENAEAERRQYKALKAKFGQAS